MTLVAKHVIVTSQPVGRVKEWAFHRRRRVAKKWMHAFVTRPDDHVDAAAVARTIDTLRDLRHWVDVTERCERQICRVLRRSGLTIRHVSQATMWDRMLRGLDPLTGRKIDGAGDRSAASGD